MPQLCTLGEDHIASLGFCQFLRNFVSFLWLHLRTFLCFQFRYKYFYCFCSMDLNIFALYIFIVLFFHLKIYVCFPILVYKRENSEYLNCMRFWVCIEACAGSGLWFYERILKVNDSYPFLPILSGRQKPASTLP